MAWDSLAVSCYNVRNGRITPRDSTCILTIRLHAYKAYACFLLIRISLLHPLLVRAVQARGPEIFFNSNAFMERSRHALFNQHCFFNCVEKRAKHRMGSSGFISGYVFNYDGHPDL